MIQRESDGMYFRFSTGTGINTMISPSLEGPWVNVGAALPNGSEIQLDGVDSDDIWVRKSNPKFNNIWLCRILINRDPKGSGPAL
jgi:hypothetical protein